jgi:hypothetical protein
MNASEPLQVEVNEVRILTTEERSLVDELTDLRKSWLKNLRESFRHIVTVAVSTIGLEAALLTFSGLLMRGAFGLDAKLVLLSLICLFGCVAIAFLGQIAEFAELPGLGTLEAYLKYKARVLARHRPLYNTASALFLVGLAMFLCAVLMTVLRGESVQSH